jgi:hypothetical protein
MVKEQEEGVMVVEGPPVLKTPTDQLCYRVITLANGLSVLLIHDPSVSEAESNANNSKENGNAANATTSMELDYMNNLTTQTPHAGERSHDQIYIQFPITFTKFFTLSEGNFELSCTVVLKFAVVLKWVHVHFSTFSNQISYS